MGDNECRRRKIEKCYRVKNCSVLQIFLSIVVVFFLYEISNVGGSFEIPIFRRRLINGIKKTVDVDENEISNNDNNNVDNLILQQNVNVNNINSTTVGDNKWENDTISLQKFMDAEYYGVIRIGNPSKAFKITFDTTWADSWLPSEHCGLLEIACMIHTRYDSSRSSTYKEDGTPFKTGDTESDLRGFVSQDSFNLAHLTVKNQSFIEITHMPWLPYGLIKADGIIGLGFPNLKRLNVPTFFNNMLKQGLIKKPVFTFYFNRDPTTERAGRLILGATERKHVLEDTLITVPVVEKLYWKIKMDRMIVNKTVKTYPFCKDGCETIFDTSTNTITGPTAEIDRINELIGARAFIPPIFKMKRFMVDCRKYAKMPAMEFVINGKTFEITSKYYVQHLTYESMEICLSPFVPSDQTFWQLGGAFLMQFYTEYDYNAGQVTIGKTKY